MEEEGEWWVGGKGCGRLEEMVCGGFRSWWIMSTAVVVVLDFDVVDVIILGSVAAVFILVPFF